MFGVVAMRNHAPLLAIALAFTLLVTGYELSVNARAIGGRFIQLRLSRLRAHRGAGNSANGSRAAGSHARAASGLSSYTSLRIA